MPELCYIQTYEKIVGSKYRPTLDRFCNVLKNIDLWNDEIKEAFDNFDWNDEEKSFTYSAISQLGYFTSKLSGVQIRPCVILNSDNWISCNFLIDADELRSFAYGFHIYTYDLVKRLVFEMQKEFKQTGIYFTDEIQDGLEFEGINCNNPAKLWQFDYAVIPLTLEEVYSNKPMTHFIKRHDNYFETWYITRWNNKS